MSWAAYLQKQAKESRTIAALKQAKALSDARQFEAKHALMRKLVSEQPGNFSIDSSSDGILGLTHTPSGFRIHVPQLVLAGTPLDISQPGQGYYLTNKPQPAAFAARHFQRGDSVGLFSFPGRPYVVEHQTDRAEDMDPNQTALSRSVRHSVVPNLQPQLEADGRVTVVTKRPIKPGEELLLDYDELPWDDTPGAHPKSVGARIQYPFQAIPPKPVVGQVSAQ